jgi:GNAT superfamily N-acetyltransferase
MTTIEYKQHGSGAELDLDQAIEVYVESTLGERRPVDNREHMAAMLRNGNLVISAWDGAKLVGIARSMSDYVFNTYLGDLAVRVSHQKRGIGKELIRRTQAAAAPTTHLLLLAAPAAVDYYPHIGFTRHEHAFMLYAGMRVSD